MAEPVIEKTYFEKLTLGVVKSLGKRQGIVDVKASAKPSAEKHNVQHWEQKYSCLMPDDLKNFYMTNNGFTLTWSVKMNETRMPVGKMEINALENLLRIGGTSASGQHIPTLSDVDLDLMSDDDNLSRPRFDHRSRIFELDPCDGYCKVCLVYNNTKPGIPAQNTEIWLMDRAFGWHLIADSFLTYYRLMLTHMGLPQWQFSLTDIGLTPQAKQWFHMYAPMRLDAVLQENKSQISVASSNSLDISKVFRGKSDKKKPNAIQQTSKKKPPTATVKNPAVGSRSARTSQLKSTK